MPHPHWPPSRLNLRMMTTRRPCGRFGWRCSSHVDSISVRSALVNQAAFGLRRWALTRCFGGSPPERVMSAKRKQQMLVHEHDQRVHHTGETVKNMNANTEFGAGQFNPHDRVVVRGPCGLASAMGENGRTSLRSKRHVRPCRLPTGRVHWLPMSEVLPNGSQSSHSQPDGLHSIR